MNIVDIKYRYNIVMALYVCALLLLLSAILSVLPTVLPAIIAVVTAVIAVAYCTPQHQQLMPCL